MTDTTRQAAAPTLEALRTAWSERDYSTTEERRTLIRMLADGKPLTAEALAHATGIEASEVPALIEAARALGVEVEDGAVVGAALTLRPTAYRFRVRGHDLYAWCGFDTIFLPMIIGEPATVASTCPVTGQEIRLTVAPDGTATEVQPPGVVVAVVGDEIMSCSTSGPDSVICTQMPFFASRQAGETWSADHPGTAILDLTQARSVARAYVFGPAE